MPGRLWLLTDRRYLGQRMPLALAEWLDERGHPPSIVLADGAGPAIWSWVERGDIVVARSRDARVPALLADAEARGAYTVDSARAVARVRDKAACLRVLARAGLPAPRTVLAHEPGDLQALPRSAYPIVVKPVFGDNARGVRIVRAPAGLHAVDWGAGPHLAQEYVEAGGVDTKLYVAGDSVWATRRTSPLLAAQAEATLVPVTPVLRDIAGRCHRAFGLSLLGIDVLESAAGMAIVDVNEFPNYTGIEEAPAVIAGLVTNLVEVAPADLSCGPS